MNLLKINNFFSLEKLTIQAFLRIIFIIIIFIFNFISENQSVEDIIIKLSFVFVSIFLSFLMFFLVKFYKRKMFLLYLQVFIDLILTTGIIFLIKQNNFLITFLYLLSITNAAIILFRTGAFIASLSSTLLTSTVYYIMISIGVYSKDYYWLTENTVYNLIIYFSYATIISVFTENLAKKDELIFQKEIELNIEKKIKNTIIDKMYSGIMVVDSSNNVLFVNFNGLKILGVSDYGKIDFNEFLPDLKNLKKSVKTKINYKDKILGLTITCFEEESFLKGKIIIFKDITEEVKLREIVKNQEKLAYLGKISAIIAHEIRNPLASISASLQIIPRFINKNPEKVTKLTQIGLKEIERLTNLLNEFLDYARHDRIKKKEIELIEILEEIKYLYDSKNDYKVLLKFNDLNEIRVNGDEDKLKQVFLNLIKNAFEAIDKKEKIVIVECMESEKEYIVTIKDDGKGISEENLKNIFDPFFTTKKNGTGLGLALVDKFISLHEGRIDIESKEGEGSKFIVYLPKI